MENNKLFMETCCNRQHNIIITRQAGKLNLMPQLELAHLLIETINKLDLWPISQIQPVSLGLVIICYMNAIGSAAASRAYTQPNPIKCTSICK